MKDQDKAPGEDTEAGKARHGYRNEVNWEGGSGRQPYANQGQRETASPGAGGVEEGNRREQSGENLDQLEAVKRKP